MTAIYPNYDQWTADCRTTMTKMEITNITKRASEWTTIVNTTTRTIDKQIRPYITISPMQDFRFYVPPNDINTKYLTFLSDWGGIKAKTQATQPRTHSDYEKKAKNWLNGRRAPNYGNSLFPDMLNAAEEYSLLRSQAVFPMDSRPDSLYNLYQKALIFGFIEKMCSSRIAVHQSWKKTHLICENSVKNTHSVMSKLLRRHAVHDWDHDRANHDKFPADTSDAASWFQEKHQYYLSLLLQSLQTGYGNGQPGSNSCAGTGDVKPQDFYPMDARHVQVQSTMEELRRELDRHKRLVRELRDKLQAAKARRHSCSSCSSTISSNNSLMTNSPSSNSVPSVHTTRTAQTVPTYPTTQNVYPGSHYTQNTQHLMPPSTHSLPPPVQLQGQHSQHVPPMNHMNHMQVPLPDLNRGTNNMMPMLPSLNNLNPAQKAPNTVPPIPPVNHVPFSMRSNNNSNAFAPPVQPAEQRTQSPSPPQVLGAGQPENVSPQFAMNGMNGDVLSMHNGSNPNDDFNFEGQSSDQHSVHSAHSLPAFKFDTANSSPDMHRPFQMSGSCSSEFNPFPGNPKPCKRARYQLFDDGRSYSTHP